MTALAFAAMVELYLHIYEGVYAVLYLADVAVGATIFYLFPDIHTRTYVVMCALAPLLIYAAVKYEEERATVDEGASPQRAS
jgi:hypothetical protein